MNSGVCLVFALKKTQKWVPPYSMEEEKCFYLVCMGITAEVETMGRGTWPKMELRQRAQEDLHLGVVWNPKTKSVNSGALYAYLSGVQRRMRHIQLPMLAAPDLASNTQKN